MNRTVPYGLRLRLIDGVYYFGEYMTPDHCINGLATQSAPEVGRRLRAIAKAYLDPLKRPR